MPCSTRHDHQTPKTVTKMDRLDSTQFFYANTMSQSHPYTLSRTYLQSLATDDASMYRTANTIVDSVVAAAKKGKTRYVDANSFYIMRENHSVRMTPENLVRFLVILRERFPECIVEYRETTRLDGTTEAGIVIDWS